jgi:hypothetical protein
VRIVQEHGRSLPMSAIDFMPPPDGRNRPGDMPSQP